MATTVLRDVRFGGTSLLRSRLIRLRAVARLECLQLLRDRTSIALIVIVPAIQLVLFGYAVNLNPKNIPLAIARQHDGSLDQLQRTIEGTGYFTIVADGLPSGAAERMVRAGTALVGIELPRRESSDADAPAIEPRIIVDATDPATVRPALAALESAYWRQLAQRSPLVLTPPTVEVNWLYNPESRTAWMLVPGLVGVVVMISMLMLGALTLVRERERGTWETLLVTPTTASEVLLGKLSPYVIIGTIQAGVVIAVARLLFALPVAGNVWALVAVVPLYATAHLMLGFIFSELAENQLQAMQGAVFFYLPSMLLSGFMFPFHGMPPWARMIGEALPLTHFVRAARGVLLRGEGTGFVVSEMVPIAIFTLLATGIALAVYRRRID